MLANSPHTAIEKNQAPKYIVVEGPIGVGKTTLAKRLAETFNYDTLLEAADENPFLSRFYEKGQQAALQTQLFFLFQRIQQIEDSFQDDLFEPIHVSDFLLEKDRLFAELNLDLHEFDLYKKIYDHLSLTPPPQPDLVIYLQAPVEILLQRIQKRGLTYERNIQADYLHRVNECYTQFFHYYDKAPLLIVNASEIDLVNSDADYESLIKTLLTVKNGRHYFNPTPITA